MGTETPYELVFFASAGTNHQIPPYQREHPTLEAARWEARRVYPDVLYRSAHTPIIYGPGLPNDGVLALDARAQSDDFTIADPVQRSV